MSTDSRSRDTPPDLQEHSSTDSYIHLRGPVSNGTVPSPTVGPSPVGDENMLFTRFMEAIEEDQTRMIESRAVQNSGIGIGDDFGHQGHSTMHLDSQIAEAGTNWFQVLSQSTHMVRVKEEEQAESEAVFSPMKSAHEPSIFYHPTNISDVDRQDIQALTPSHRLRAAASRTDEGYVY